MTLQIIRKNVECLSSTLFKSKAWREFSTVAKVISGTKLNEKLAPNTILNDVVRQQCVRRMKSLTMTKKVQDNPNKAAVLVPLCIHEGKLGLLYTLRSNKVRLNRGQVSFPGGMKDDSDKTLEDTALRETWEELRIPKKKVDVWGIANPIERKHVSVLPVLGYIGEIDPKSLRINTHEVEEAFVHPLEKLCDPAQCHFTQYRDNYTLPVYLGGNHKIWGLTAVITHMIMSALVPDIYKHKLTYLQPLYKEKEAEKEKENEKENDKEADKLTASTRVKTL